MNANGKTLFRRKEKKSPGFFDTLEILLDKDSAFC
jgi:hypothetical protein